MRGQQQSDAIEDLKKQLQKRQIELDAAISQTEIVNKLKEESDAKQRQVFEILRIRDISIQELGKQVKQQGKELVAKEQQRLELEHIIANLKLELD